MVVYAEQILFDNLCVDGVLMLSVCRALSLSTTKPRLFFAALTGSIAALISAVFGSWVGWVLKLLTAPLMVIIALKHTTVKKYFFALGLMLSFTFAYGGACYLVMEWVSIDVMRRVPIGLMTLTVCALAILIFRLTKGLVRRRARQSYIYRIALTVNGLRIETDAYLDTGNALTHGGLPVILADASVLSPALGRELTASILLHRAPSAVEGSYIECNTVKGGGKIFVFRPDKVEIYFSDKPNTVYDVMVGIDFVHPIEDCKVLLSPYLTAEV